MKVIPSLMTQGPETDKFFLMQYSFGMANFYLMIKNELLRKYNFAKKNFFS